MNTLFITTCVLFCVFHSAKSFSYPICGEGIKRKCIGNYLCLLCSEKEFTANDMYIFKKENRDSFKTIKKLRSCFNLDKLFHCHDCPAIPIEELIYGIEFMITDFFIFYINYMSAVIMRLLELKIIHCILYSVTIVGIIIFLYNVALIYTFIKRIQYLLIKKRTNSDSLTNYTNAESDNSSQE